MLSIEVVHPIYMNDSQDLHACCFRISVRELMPRTYPLNRRSFLRGTILGSVALRLPAAAETADRNELAHWNFDGSDGYSVDTVSGGQDAISSRTCQPEFKSGIAGSALRFDGYSVWISRSASRAPQLSREFTLQLWVAVESYPVSDGAFINQHNRQDSGFFFGLDKYGFFRLAVSVQGDWQQCTSPEPVPRFRWVHLAASFDRRGVITLYQDGLKVSAARGRPGPVKQATGVELLIGKTNGCPYAADLFATGVVNGLIDELTICNRSLSVEQIRQAYARGSSSTAPDLAVPPTEFAQDPHRPTYHAMPPRAWTNEPHGLIRFKGEYHLFYQKNANGPYWGQINWGHMVSPDLLHWRELHPALSPEPGLDAAGCWSGSTIEYQGELAIIYTAVDGKKASICLATSKDGKTFSKYSGNPIISAPPAGLNLTDFRDPFVWSEGDSFYMIIGSGVRNVGGTALLYKSSDLLQWGFLGRLLQGDKETSGTFWEMPVFFPLGEKYILIVTEVPGRSSYWVGEWENEQFHPDQKEPKRLELINHFLSPTPLRPEQGAVAVIGIIPETRKAREVWKAGWAHVYSLPRVLSLNKDGLLQQESAAELQILRGKCLSITNKRIDAGRPIPGDHSGTAVEILAKFRRGDAQRVGLRLRRSPDRQEETLLYYDWKTASITLDRTHSSIDPDVARTRQSGPFSLVPDELLELHVFVDRSVLEVFVNGRGTLASRIYPTRRDSDGIDLLCEGGPCFLERLNIWQINPA
jgi:fructan beta-fructosidase